MLNYYHILGISANATQREIVAAYRAKCKLLHPDVNPSADATLQMQMVNEAYQTLSNSSLRYQNDVQQGYYAGDDTISSEQYEDDDSVGYGPAWWEEVYRPPAWHEKPIDDWCEKHKDDRKKTRIIGWFWDVVCGLLLGMVLRIPGWFWYVVYGLFLVIVIVRIVIPVIWGIIELFKILVY